MSYLNNETCVDDVDSDVGDVVDAVDDADDNQGRFSPNISLGPAKKLV